MGNEGAWPGERCDTNPVAEGPEERRLEIQSTPEMLAGVYANFANVSYSNYEFTITFMRVEHEADDVVPGVVVSRVNVSPMFMPELMEAMADNFSKWQTREGIRDLPEADLPPEAE